MELIYARSLRKGKDIDLKHLIASDGKKDGFRLSRRQLLKHVGVSTLAVPLIPLLPACNRSLRRTPYRSELINVMIDVVEMVGSVFGVGDEPEGIVHFINLSKSAQYGPALLQMGQLIDRELVSGFLGAMEPFEMPPETEIAFKTPKFPMLEKYGLHRTKADSRKNYRIADFLVG